MWKSSKQEVAQKLAVLVLVSNQFAYLQDLHVSRLLDLL
jgi:hypothetical protein